MRRTPQLDNGYTLIEMSSHMNGKPETTQEACANEQQALLGQIEKAEAKIKVGETRAGVGRSGAGAGHGMEAQLTLGMEA